MGSKRRSAPAFSRHGMGEFPDLFEGIGLCLSLTIRFKSDVTARRLEVITETGRGGWFSRDDIVEETRVRAQSFPSLPGDTG